MPSFFSLSLMYIPANETLHRVPRPDVDQFEMTLDRVLSDRRYRRSAFRPTQRRRFSGNARIPFPTGVEISAARYRGPEGVLFAAYINDGTKRITQT